MEANGARGRAMVRPGGLGKLLDVREQDLLFLGHVIDHLRRDRLEAAGDLVQLRPLGAVGARELLQVRGQCRQRPAHVAVVLAHDVGGEGVHVPVLVSHL